MIKCQQQERRYEQQTVTKTPSLNNIFIAWSSSYNRHNLWSCILLKNFLHNHQRLILFAFSRLYQTKFSVQEYGCLHQKVIQNFISRLSFLYLVVFSDISINIWNLPSISLLDNPCHQSCSNTFPEMFIIDVKEKLNQWHEWCNWEWCE